MKFAGSLYEESIYEKWQERRTKIRERDLSSHVKLAFLGGGVTGWRWRRRLRKVLVTRKRRSNDERDVGGGAAGGEGEKHQQATRGSNLPERRDFASEAGANC